LASIIKFFFLTPVYCAFQVINGMKLPASIIRSSRQMPFYLALQAVYAAPVYASESIVVPAAMIGASGIVLIVLALALAAAIVRQIMTGHRLREIEKQHKRVLVQLSTEQSITHIGSWDQDLETDRIYWSDETYRIFGYEPGAEQLTGSFFVEGVHPEDRKQVLAVWSEAIKNKTGYTADHRVIQPGGAVRYVRETAEIQLDDSGKPVRFIGTVQDVTEKIRTAQALDSSENYFRSITENVQEIICILLDDGTIVYGNQSAKTILGYDPKLMVGQNMTYFIHPDDQGSALRGVRIAARRQSIKHDLPLFNVRVRKFDGVWRTLEIRVRYLDDQEGQSRILAVSRDVTDQITAGQELQRNNNLLELLGNVGIAANFSQSLEEALQLSVDEVCRATGWPIGHAYIRSNTDKTQLLPTNIWNKSVSSTFENFQRITESTSFSRGIGLPGRVFFSAQPAWITDVMVDNNFPRAGIDDDFGVHGAFAFPVLSGDSVVAVLEFFNTVPSQPDHELLEILAKVGAQLGRVSERRMADLAIRESEARFRGFAESASDWFWEVDVDMRYTRFTGRNEEISGISSDKNVGHSRTEILQDILIDEEKSNVEKWAEHNALLERHEAFQDFCYAVNRPDGEIIHLRVNGIPTFDETGQFTGYRGTARDETSEVEARQEEAAARALLLDATESLEDGIALFDADDRLVMYNKPFGDMTEGAVVNSLKIGETFEELLTRWAGGGGYNLSPDELIEFVASRMEQHRNLPSSNIYHLADGDWVHISERRTSDGGCVLVRHSITGLKQTEEALRDSEERMRRLIDIAPEAIIVADRHMKIQIFNAGAERAFGYRAKDAIGKNIEMLMPRRFRSGHDAYVRGFEASDAVERPMSDRSNIIGLRKNGEEFPSEAAISKLFTPEGPVFTVMLRDITTRVQAENELQNARAHLEDAIETISQAVSLWGPDRKLVLFNQNFTNLFGKHADEVIAGQTFDEVVEVAFRNKIFGHDPVAAADYLRKRKLSFERADAVPLSRKNNNDRYYQVIDVRTHDGGVLSVGSDITDAVTRERYMKDAMQHAELANRAKSEFLANMSHELRTPLNAILGFSEILQTEPFGELGDHRYAEYVTDIHDSGSHLLEIINDILDLSRIEAGQVSLREESVDVREVTERVLTMLRGRATEDGVAIIDELVKDLPNLYADARILRQILVNLISNAVKFSEEGKEVSVSAEINATGEFIICVSDEGIGIKEEDMARVLEPFGQADSSLTRTFEGVGLGLPLTKSFVEMHGGELHIESEEGVGTSVLLAFPPERVVEDKAPSN
jgi:PAS domain S-box-containing protein